MSYSSLNDAFNINTDFEKTIRGLNSFNQTNNTIENNNSRNNYNSSESNPHFESNYFGNTKGKNSDQNYQNNFYNPNDPLPIIDGMYTGDDNLSWESLNGTDLNSRGDNISSSNKLTHRDCIKIYNNPDSYNDRILSQALKHVSKCKDCKENIKNTILTNDIKKNSKSNSTSQQQITKSTNSNMKKNINTINDNTSLLSAYQQFYNPVNSGSLNLSTQSNTQSNNQSNTQSSTNSKIESELKVLSEKINGETNLKYQNALIQNNISKYLEDLEERKKINQKLDNILEMIKSEHISKQNNRDMKLNVGSETTSDNNLMNILTSPQFLLNLSKINDLSRLNEQQTSNIINTSQSPPTSFETYLLYISIFIIIVLLIIDIVLRISAKTD
jgi:hypothetical protein